LTSPAKGAIPDLQDVFIKEESMKPAALALCGLVLTLAPAASAEIPYIVGDSIADFTLNDAYGTPVSLYDHQGKVIWLVFWTST
jgi:cytochrome oxidase Cu insertion factor (SCO1/SenC/PrrC family)